MPYKIEGDALVEMEGFAHKVGACVVPGAYDAVSRFESIVNQVGTALTFGSLGVIFSDRIKKNNKKLAQMAADVNKYV